MGNESSLPSVSVQADKLIRLGVPQILGQSTTQVKEAALALEQDLKGSGVEALLVPSQSPIAYADLLALVQHQGKNGFVVEDFVDSAEFIPVVGPGPEPVLLPDSPWYLLICPKRGDEFQNASPAEALASISSANQFPLTITEGIFWLLQLPEVLERNHCFMTIGSRKPKGNGVFDSRTPALWISNGTGRDGRANRDAPKLGWCWWNNRHTWLGIAYAQQRVG